MSKNKNNTPKAPFAQRHPKLYALICLAVLIFLIGVVIFLFGIFIDYVRMEVSEFLLSLSSAASNLDAVIVVALITGTVSLTGVIISSIVSKIIDYKKSRKAYLAQKREKPYGDFVDMVYKLQQYSKDKSLYTEKNMVSDIYGFSKEITLWGSSRVAKKWIKFRENSTSPEAATKNLFIIEEIMNEMRKDLGQKKLNKGDLLAFFVNDIKKVVKEGLK